MTHYTSFHWISDFEKACKDNVTINTWEKLLGYSERGITFNRNEEIFKKLFLKYRVFRNVSNRNLSTKILGQKVSMPIGISPSGRHKLFCPEGELGTAKAAAAKGCLMVQSPGSSYSMAEVGPSTDGIKWCQLYIYDDKEITLKFVREAERCGYKAISVITDIPRLYDGRRPAKLEVPPHAKRLGTFESLGFSTETLSKFSDTTTWEDFRWLKSITKLPVVAKGIMTGEDARLAVEAGADGIWVSNHGGRQMDTARATLEVLPEVVAAVNGRAEVFLDGGIRHGSDVLKALAIGARAVLIGRPALWGLVCGGSDGLNKILSILEEELDSALAFTGCTSVEDVPSSVIDVRTPFSKL